MSFDHDTESFMRELGKISQKVKDLEQIVSDMNKVDTVQNRNTLSIGEIITDGGQELSTPKQETYTGIVTTGQLTTPIDLTSESYNTLMMQITGKDNAGTFTSCTVDLEYSFNNITYFPLFSLSLVAGDLVAGVGSDLGEIKKSSFYLKYNVTEKTLVGNATIDITLGAILT